MYDINFMITMRFKKEFINFIGKSFPKTKRQAGFSYIELLFSSFLLIIIVIGLLYTYIACFELNEFSRNLTLANNALQAKLETVREKSFDDIVDEPFDLDDWFPLGEAKGLVDVYVPNPPCTYSDLKYIRLVACWRQKSGRVIGEDSNLDGVLQVSEDLDGDGVLDSPAEIITLISEIE